MEPVHISGVIRAASNLSVILPLVVYLLRMRYAARQIHVIGILIIVSGLADLVGFVLLSGGQSTVELFNVYYILLFILLSWFYYEVMLASTRRLVIGLGSVVYLISFMLVSAYVQDFRQYQTLMWVITAIIMITYSISYFFYSVSTISSAAFYAYGLIWINIGVMIYFCLSLFLFVMGSYVLTKLDADTSALIWSSHNINNIIKNILFAIGIFVHQRSPDFVKSGQG